MGSDDSADVNELAKAAPAPNALPAKAQVGRGRPASRPWYRQLRIVGAATGVVVLACVGTALAVASRGEHVALPSLAPTPASSPSPSRSPSAAEGPLPSAAAVVHDDLSTVATIAGEEIAVYGNAGDATPITTLTQWTYYGQTLTMLSIEREMVDGVAWHHVMLPIQPNGSDGWVKESDVSISTTNKEIRVYLDTKVLEFYVGDERKLKASVVVGKPSTPTPTGTAFVSDLLDLSANTKGIYGAYALGLSAYSETLKEFNDGPPQIAIHGTNEPWLRGHAESNGCIRLSNEDVVELATWVDAGTPVHVFATSPSVEDLEDAAATDEPSRDTADG